MAKLTAQTEFRKDGSKNIKAYKATLAKKSVEEIAGFDKDTELDIVYEKDKITIKKNKKLFKKVLTNIITRVII